MPEIARFFGIIIALFYDDHNPPHFHARYGSEKIIVEIESLKVLEGKISPRALGLIIEWATQHQSELKADWDLVKNNQVPKKIDPLK
jgi:hypothetical protein